MKISEHIYVYLWTDQKENNCNSVFIDGKVPLLIDPGLAHRTQSLFNRMQEDGVDHRRIKVVVITHAHPDHFGGTVEFPVNQTKIGLAKEEKKYIEEIGRPMYLKHGMKIPDYRVDFYLRDGDLSLGKHDFQVLLTPGHSPGSVCLYWPRYKALFPGDVVFMNGVGRTDLPGGNIKSLKESVERLSKLSVELLVPGHGPAIQGKERIQKNFEGIKRAFLNTT
ncbi:MAG: MBL fold metallo-hydrolase [Deltaproteobacteria bacterium]|nr:MBL fold metallo-hydrolase [Deltaproteobacteria bacterium]